MVETSRHICACVTSERVAMECGLFLWILQVCSGIRQMTTPHRVHC